MAEYLSESIADLIKDIASDKVILPAIQRNFVWPDEKVSHLFDSLMRDYPIGTFLFWDIDSTTFGQFAFNQFITDIDDSKELQRGLAAQAGLSEYTAVLDGQQCITSLYVGVQGKHRAHLKGRKWNDPASFVDTYLCLDIIEVPDNDEDEYHFSFIPDSDTERLIYDAQGKPHYWIKVATVFKDGFDAADFMDDFDAIYSFGAQDRKERRKVLTTLHDSLTEKPNVNYYVAKKRSLPEVVDIFVRVNSGGQKLAASDLMLSVAAGTQGDTDIHVKMQDAINYINSSVRNPETGLKVDKELILTAGLLFIGAQSLSLQKKDNYCSDNMNSIFLSNWDNIIAALANTVQYIEHIGFSGQKLTSKNAILPIAYYFYKNNLNNTHINSTSNRAQCDIIFIRQWLLRVMINDVFMDGIGSTLLRIREVLDKSTKAYFPLDELMQAKIKRPLDIGTTQIEDICELEYGDVKVLPILMELGKYPPNYAYQVDHIWPKAFLLTKRGIRSKFATATETVMDEYRSRCNTMPNLQLLNAIVNQQKSDMTFDNWIAQTNQQPYYYQANLIPIGISYAFDNFVMFTDKRRELLSAALSEAFPSNFSDIVRRFGLENKI